MPKRRVLLVDDEVALLLTMKAVLEISGYDVDTATSAREGKLRIRTREYQMVITDMRMESDAAGREVIQAARTAPYHPAVALLTAYPETEEDWQDGAPDKVLIKATETRKLLGSLEALLEKHAAKLGRLSAAAAAPAPLAEKPRAKKSAAKRLATRKLPEAKAVKTAVARKAPAKKSAAKKSAKKK